jgi:flagellin-specific chaperone FliS
MENNPQILEEAASLLVEIKSAWDAVPEIIKKEAQQHVSAQATSSATSSV